MSNSDCAFLRADQRKRKWLLRERSEKCERNSPVAPQSQSRRRAGGIEHRAIQKTMAEQAVSLQPTGSMWSISSHTAHGGPRVQCMWPEGVFSPW